MPDVGFAVSLDRDGVDGAARDAENASLLRGRVSFEVEAGAIRRLVGGDIHSDRQALAGERPRSNEKGRVTVERLDLTSMTEFRAENEPYDWRHGVVVGVVAPDREAVDRLRLLRAVDARRRSSYRGV